MSRNQQRRQKRCAECDELFYPNLRVGNRQRYCADDPCQLARKRDYQRRWREAHPAEEQGRRLREALGRAAPVAPRPRKPLDLIPWDEIEAELGRGTHVVFKCVLGIMVRWLLRSGTADRRSLPEPVPRSADVPSKTDSDKGIQAIDIGAPP